MITLFWLNKKDQLLFKIYLFLLELYSFSKNWKTQSHLSNVMYFFYYTQNPSLNYIRKHLLILAKSDL